MLCRTLWAGLAALVILAPVSLEAQEAKELAKLPEPADVKVDFEEHIKPIFQARCYSCHGREESEGGLSLHRRADAVQGDSGETWVKGNSAESRIIKYVTGLNEYGYLMPPEGEGTPLSKEHVALLRAWIDQGAEWPQSADVVVAKKSDHWSFQPAARPELPEVKNEAWLHNPIDAFVLARLEAEGIEPAPEADRATLVRRLHLDITGLPPTPAEHAEAMNDSRADWYAQLVDRLLDSPHYGERWGRHWLDLARYADSDGYEKDRPRPFAWRYRNWVIDAFNRDLPYDQFTVAQLAGDLLPEAGLSEKVATGFHRQTLHNTEGGTDPEEDRVKKTVDRTNTLGTVWLGLTVGCAQCHSHKYDPIAQREFYSLYAFFNNIEERDVSAPLAEEQARYEEAKAAFEREHKKFAEAVAEYEKTKLAEAQAAWEKGLGEAPATWTLLEVTGAKSKNGATLKQQDDGSWLASGKNGGSDVYTIEAATDLADVTAIRLEVLPDTSLPKNGPGRSPNGNFVLSTVRVEAAPAGDEGEAKPVALAGARADFSQKDWPVAAAINDDKSDGWAVSPEFGNPHVAVFETAANVGFAGGTRLTIALDQHYEGDTHNLGRFRLSATSHQRPVPLEGIPADVADVLAVAAEKRSDAQRKVVAEYYKKLDPELAKLRQAASEHAKKAPKPPGTKAMAVAERSTPRETKIHIRGDFLRKGETVEAAVPEVLPPVEARGERPDRLDLARWVVSDENPLTPRVTVNRLWQRYFGRGLVESSDDFGSQGDPPTHPELLDWLASEFRDSGWSLKHVHRLIVNSATYRQSSAVRPELMETDPTNELLARQTRQRVEAEIVRDLALAASGLLDRTIGGPSVRPPQPAEYSKLTYANSARWQVSAGGDRYRRGMYTFFQRTSPYPMLMTFDSPDSTSTCPRRAESNTPLQALTLWNDPVFFECAQVLGRRIVEEVPGDAGAADTVANRVRHAFVLCLARQPSPAELEAVADLYRDQAELAEQDAAAAKEIVGSRPIPDGSSPAELAAWVIVGRTLLNLDEFITRE